MNALALLSLALAPGAAIVLYIYLRDKHEREPLWLLIVSFLYGGLSTIITLAISFPVNLILFAETDSAIHKFFTAFFKVALIEEFSKFIFVRFVLYYNKNFNEPFDGIVYAIMVGMGFATVENIIYVFQYGYKTGLLRMFTAVPAHAVFALLMGYFIGKAKFTHRRTTFYSILALLGAAAFHGSYDYFWFISFIPGILAGAVVSIVLCFALARLAIRLHQQSAPFIDIESPAERTDAKKELR